MFIRKLVLSNLLARKSRASLTVAAVALSVSLVVSVTSGYASVEAMAYNFAARYMGSADLIITRRGIASNLFSESLVDELRKDPEVKRVTGRHRPMTLDSTVHFLQKVLSCKRLCLA